MFKRILLYFFLTALITGGFFAYKVFGPGTAFNEKSLFVYIRSLNPDKGTVEQVFSGGNIISNPRLFMWLAGRMDYWNKIKPGKYEIKKGESLFNIIRMLRNGRQTPVNLVINKLRTKEDFARFAGRQLECDSLSIISFFTSNDSLQKFELDSNRVMTAVIPNTYTMFWNTTASKLFKRLFSEQQMFWTDERKNKAAAIGLTPAQVYSLASVIEEETNKNDEKPLIASVYLNRLNKGMPLGADPTIKYALRDFGIKRILFKHIDESAGSPYNTYRNKGIPPGPICTPSVKSIDAVLNAKKTDYLFFCAKADFSGYHAFAATDKEHYKNAKAYQQALDSLLIK
ncbi:MAG: endolytic transglycosylase MltG [Chitinophagaceae bacterium]|nr:endolytic transglycosylase MltG [Chitinophagaceae bacterium]